MIQDIFDRKKLRRALLYALCFIIAIILQEFLFSHIAILGVHAFFVPVFVLAVGFFEGGVWGGVFGLITGLICDLCFSGSGVLLTILYPVIGFGGGLLVEYYVNARFFSFLFVSAAVLLLTAFCQMFRLLFFMGADAMSLLYVGALQCLWSLPFTLCAYFPSRAISRGAGEEV